ncbi:aminotransferase, class IV [Clostridium sp. DMHC 10]|uniref:aminotransferase class IV n=1 Tax=Clostridium sp. DMHC 10 TaxID=747377 RepID=UPI00069EEDE0|nr:aminotransferase class IV [Clostridium sp. DMHC 10]KOF55901.1 aminotransferase, class IV [Clostridium sp. DMHC 10]
MEIIENDYYIFNEDIKGSNEFDGNFISKGKSLYEVIRIYKGIPLFFEKHIYRMINSANISNLKLPFNNEKLKDSILRLTEINKVQFGNIKVVFNFYNNECNFYCYFIKHHYPSEKDYKEGVATILFKGERKNPNAKIMDVSFREGTDKAIKNKRVFEAILVDRNGNITEGSKSNIFMVKGDCIYTSPVEDVLPGITRDIIIKVVLECGYKIKEERVNYENIKYMDGLFISGTSPKVLPINKVDTICFDSSNNSVIKEIHKSYDNYLEQYVSQFS